MDSGKTFILVLLLFPILLFGQISFLNSKGEQLYEEGTQAFKNSDFILADSLLTEALGNKYQNADVFFNRAYARYYLRDTVGFCDDMWIASYKFDDKEATQIITKNCCNRVDTIFYNKKGMLVDRGKYRYHEVIHDFKYHDSIHGLCFDKKKSGLENISGMMMWGKYTMQVNALYPDVFAEYLIVSNEKLYTHTEIPPMVKNFTKYNRMKKLMAAELFQEFKSYKIDLNEDKLVLHYLLKINSEGYIVEILHVSSFYDISAEKLLDMKKVLQKYVSKYPKMTPAKFFKEKVSYIVPDSIEF